MKKKYTTVLDASLRYGKNLKDKHNKNRLELSLDATHKLSGARKQVNYSVEFKFPAKVITVKTLNDLLNAHLKKFSVVTIKFKQNGFTIQ